MKLLTSTIALVLAGCVTTSRIDSQDPFAWSSLGSGCYEHGLADAISMPDDVGLTDIRIGRLPDTGQGPGLMAHFRRHAEGAFSGSARRAPDLLLVVDDWRRSCAAVVELSDCPNAESIYSSLSVSSIPIDHAFNDPQGITLLHGTQYFLSTRDGKGNELDWRYYGSGHPLERKISASLDDLALCATPAALAFLRRGSSYSLKS